MQQRILRFRVAMLSPSIYILNSTLVGPIRKELHRQAVKAQSPYYQDGAQGQRDKRDLQVALELSGNSFVVSVSSHIHECPNNSFPGARHRCA